MRIDVELDGRRRSLEVRREASGWVVTLDGRPIRAAVADAGGRWSLLVGPPEGERCESDVASGGSRPWRSYEIAFEGDPGGEQIVHVNGEPVPVTVIEPRPAFRRRGHDAAGDAGPKSVVAPMPGRIVKVLVKPGDAVNARQGVVVVEAMKMENELRAPKAGTVREVRVSEGASVEAHSVLVVIE